MLFARLSSSTILVAGKSLILIFSRSDGSLLRRVDISEVPLSKGQEGQKNGDKKESGAGAAGEPLFITACQVSPDQSLCCIADSKKRLLVYKTDSWSLIKQFSMERKVSIITFDSSCTRIMATDRTGDVYLVKMDETEPCLLMGHLSIILSQVLTADDKFLVTGDRDEKIRVSHFPNSYNIQTYCLAHEEFVSSLCLMDERTLVSGSGDGTIKLWDFRCGRLIVSQDCGPDHSVKHIVKLGMDRIAVSFYCKKWVHVYRIDADRMEKQAVIDLQDEMVGMEGLDDESLLLTTRNPEKCLQVISISGDHPHHHHPLDSPLNSINSELRTCLSPGESWSGSAGEEEEVRLLKKEAYDNVQQYLLRKQEREQQEESKRQSVSRKRQRILSNQTSITNDSADSLTAPTKRE